MARGGWRWRGMVALTATSLAFVIYPLTEPGRDVISSSDWPAFATGAKVALSDPSHLYDLDVQKRVQLEVTGGQSLVTLGIHGILPFLAPAWVALLAVPFEVAGIELGGRLWVLFGLACLAFGLGLATRPRPPDSILPAFATVPTALMLLNAQLDGTVALGIGAAFALWTRPYIAGLALGLTLMKPHLMLPLGFALLATRRWRVLAGWATAGAVLWASYAVLDPRWVLDWLAPAAGTVQPGGREIDLPHLATLLPSGLQTIGVAVLTVGAIAAVVLLARRRRDDLRSAAAIVVSGGVLAAPHALAADLVLVAMALAIWGRARWYDWLILSVGAAIAALIPPPMPVLVGIVVIGWVCLRAAGGFSEWRPAPRQESPG